MQPVFINNNQNGFHNAPVCDSIMSEILKTKNAADRVKKIRRNGTAALIAFTRITAVTSIQNAASTRLPDFSKSSMMQS